MNQLGEDARNRLAAIQRAAGAGDLAGATQLAESALADGLEHPLVLNLVAVACEDGDDLSQAIALLRRAVDLAPTDPGSRIALGLCLRRAGELDEALECFDAVIELAPGLPFGYVNRGATLQVLGRLGEAAAAFDRCLAIDATNPVALAGQARIASLMGSFDDARRLGMAALAKAPSLPDAVLAVAAADLAEHEFDAAERRLTQFLGSASPSPQDEADVRGLLGDVLDAAGRVHAAFAAYSDANAILRRAHGPSYETSRRAMPYARSMAEALSREQPIAVNDDPANTGPARHAFLLGFPRSGTTLLEVTLDGHPGIVSLEEKELMLDAARCFLNSPQDLHRLLQRPDADLGLDEFRTLYWQAALEAGASFAGKLFLDKYPLNTLKLPLIVRLFPRARILFAVRDPRDVVLSCYRRRFRMSPPMYEMLTLRGAAEYYATVMAYAKECLRVLHLQPRYVRYEQLVEDFDGETSRLCAFLGLEWSAEMGDFAGRAKRRASATPSTAQLSRGLDRALAGQWQRYANEMDEVMPILAPWVREFGYDPEPGTL